MSRAPRVVLDTNLVLSALVFSHGRLAALRHAWHEARCQPLVSQATVAELVRALTYPKFALTPEQQREVLADYLPFCTAVPMRTPPPKTPVCRDPFDVPFLQLAVAGNAAYLVAGDRDLLALAGKLTCPIVTASELLTELAKVGAP